MLIDDYKSENLDQNKIKSELMKRARFLYSRSAAEGTNRVDDLNDEISE